MNASKLGKQKQVIFFHKVRPCEVYLAAENSQGTLVWRLCGCRHTWLCPYLVGTRARHSTLFFHFFISEMGRTSSYSVGSLQR